MRIVLISIVLILMFGCGASTSSTEGRMISISELSQTEWTAVSEGCYRLLVSHQEVIGMIDNGQYLLMLVIREQD